MSQLQIHKWRTIRQKFCSLSIYAHTSESLLRLVTYVVTELSTLDDSSETTFELYWDILKFHIIHLMNPFLDFSPCCYS
jgi:hypothetical protein